MTDALAVVAKSIAFVRWILAIKWANEEKNKPTIFADLTGGLAWSPFG